MVKALFKDAAIYGLSTAIAQFASLLLIPIYTRVFSPADYGSIDLISTIVGLTAVISMLQLESAVNRQYYAEKSSEQKKEMLSTAFWTILVSSITITVVAVVVSNSFSQVLLNNSNHSISLVIAFIAVPLLNLNGLFSVIIRYQRKPIRFLLLQLIQVFSILTCSYVFVIIMRLGITGVFVGQGLGLLIGFFSKWVYLRTEFAVKWNRHSLKQMLLYSLPLVPAVIGSWGNTYVNRFVMISYLPLADIGLYSLAIKFVSVIQLLGTALKMAWQPIFWEAYEKDPNHISLFKSVQEQVTLGAFLMAVFLALFAREILQLVTGTAFFESAKLIGFLALSMALSQLISPFTLIGPGIKKQTSYNTFIFVAGVVTNVICSVVLLPVMGVKGAAISLLVSSTVSLCLSWYYSEKLYPVRFNKCSASVSYACSLVIIVVLSLHAFLLSYKIILSVLLLSAFAVWLTQQRQTMLQKSKPLV